MENQRQTARDARANLDVCGWEEDITSNLDKNIKSSFEGYDNLGFEANISAIIVNNESVESTDSEEAIIILDKTPFYPEGGGQTGDIGILCDKDGNTIATVTDTKKGTNDTIKHFIKLSSKVKVSDTLFAKVDKTARFDSARNHSATHLLHKALKEVLGSHVNQAGSLVNRERLRFDVTHFEAITKDELKLIEQKVNEAILEALPINCETMNIDKAKEKGAMALFGEKYGDVVRVVSMGDYSIELCGGTHLTNTSQIGMFKILSEGGVSFWS